MADRTFSIEVTMDERWINDFCSMLKWMEHCGNIGHSSLIGFYSDGDGDFKPNFEIDTEFQRTEGIWNRDNPIKQPEVLFDAG